MGQIVKYALAASVALAGLLLAAGGADLESTLSSPADESSALVPRRIPVDAATRIPAQPEVTLHGVVQARHRLRLALPVSGTLIERPIEVGDRVETGELLARVDNPDLIPARDARLAEIEALEIRAAQLDRELERFTRLAHQAMVSEDKVDALDSDLRDVRARGRLAQANLAAAQRAIDESRGRAKFPAIVTEAHYEIGEFVPAGRPILTLSGLDGFEVEVQAPESVIMRLGRGDPVAVTLPFHPDIQVDGTIRQLADAAASNGLFSVIVELPAAERLRAGLSAHVHLGGSEATRLAVPLSAVVGMTGDSARVFRIEDDVARAVAVTVDGVRGRFALVSGSLREGEPIAVRGAGTLRDGERVELP